MIKYPRLNDNYTIGITAPSSGIPENCHHFMDEIKERFKDVNLLIGDTVMTQYKAKSSHMNKRAKELNEFLQREDIDIVIPPWGGELAIEVIDKIDYANIQPKWIMGYSDTSLILLTITLNTGIATAHGTNIVDLRGKYSDETTSMWEQVLKTQRNDEVIQYSSDMFQKSWAHHVPTDYIFNFTEQTIWKSLSGEVVKIEGRLLGGCIDVISHIVGTPFGYVDQFRNKYLNGEPIIWYLENCELLPLTVSACS
ncbi:LD-carboxypeptidase [Macrococcoides canis]|uniref:LD-carboxypeptidase n=1 Tax=Macrococcoides canis TaxID=1855823 RepID=UPI00207C264A|nr:LD-carboxypeptidase [Macrococcus canis]MCO4097675.1 LD-carboxypeptidase [Macrococcus canis]UTH09534.1 LD-carboxypeptidase [Macrococcus canis]